MEGLTEVSVGQLLDKLVINHLKCWHALEIIDELKSESTDTMSEHDLKRLAKASQVAHSTNRARAILVSELDRRINDKETFVERKNYSDA